MSRPLKDNADYFSHDTDMRNDDRIKALRKKFGTVGYGIWNMILEYLTDKDHFVFEYNDFTLELMSGDFGEDPELIKSVIEHCIFLKLIQHENGFIKCKTLVKRLEPLLSKRKRDRKDVSDSDNEDGDVLSTSKTHKVKKRKGKDMYISHGSGDISITIKKVYTTDKMQRIYEVDKYFESKGQLEDLKQSGFIKFREFLEANPGRMFNDDDHVYSSFKKFCIENPNVTVLKVDNPFSEAEYNKSQWTDKAWRERYQKQIQNNPQFRQYFGL